VEGVKGMRKKGGEVERKGESETGRYSWG